MPVVVSDDGNNDGGRQRMNKEWHGVQTASMNTITTTCDSARKPGTHDLTTPHSRDQPPCHSIQWDQPSRSCHPVVDFQSCAVLDTVPPVVDRDDKGLVLGEVRVLM